MTGGSNALTGECWDSWTAHQRITLMIALRLDYRIRFVCLREGPCVALAACRLTGPQLDRMYKLRSQ